MFFKRHFKRMFFWILLLKFCLFFKINGDYLTALPCLNCTPLPKASIWIGQKKPQPQSAHSGTLCPPMDVKYPTLEPCLCSPFKSANA